MTSPCVPSTKSKRVLDFSIESLVGKTSDRDDKRPTTPKSPQDSIASGLTLEKDYKTDSVVKRFGFQPVTTTQYRLNAFRKLHGLGSNTFTESAGLPSALGQFGLHSTSPLCFPPMLHGALPTMLMGTHHRDLPHHIYPWIMARYPSLLAPRLAGDPSLLLQPFRKPKRIRTAFSPSQLLRLEHSFEKNHYVVGQERKDLAVSLNLTETQVKVWFQNRRTKYKRMKAEEGGEPEPLTQAQLLEDEFSEEEDESSPSKKCKSSHHVDKWRADTSQIWESEES